MTMKESPEEDEDDKFNFKSVFSGKKRKEKKTGIVKTDRRNMTQQEEKAEKQKVDAQIEAVLANPYRSLS